MKSKKNIEPTGQSLVPFKNLDQLMKELPSLEAVYIYLDNFVRREKAKLPRGDAWLFSYKIMKAENMRLDYSVSC